MVENRIPARCFWAVIFLVYATFFSLYVHSFCEHMYSWESHRESDTGRGRVQFVWQCRHLAAHMDTGDNWPGRCLHSPILTSEDGLDKMSSFKWSYGKLWPRSQPAPWTSSIDGGGRCEYFENDALLPSPAVEICITENNCEMSVVNQFTNNRSHKM